MNTRAASWLRHRLGRAVILSDALALILPAPGLWLRGPHPLPPSHLPVHTAPLLLSLVLFSAGLQVPLRALGALLRHPKALLITTSLPGKPHLLLPVLAYGLLQKTAANRIVTRLRPAPIAV
ncbi:hypothetical protein AB0H51_22590 [Streptomyces griseoluteus]|uniref:hypothetical protein n=1 Tax=Streptomyces griseoluteus TaxID=29306 RepID=UPI0033C05A85